MPAGCPAWRDGHSHDVVGLQPRVGRRVDEDVGEGVLLVVHLVCRGDRAPRPSPLGPEEPGLCQPSWPSSLSLSLATEPGLSPWAPAPAPSRHRGLPWAPSPAPAGTGVPMGTGSCPHPAACSARAASVSQMGQPQQAPSTRAHTPAPAHTVDTCTHTCPCTHRGHLHTPHASAHLRTHDPVLGLSRPRALLLLL